MTRLLVIAAFISWTMMVGCQQSSSQEIAPDGVTDTTAKADRPETAELLPENATELRRELARCAAVEGALTRLDCYDRISESYGLILTTEDLSSAEGTGKWRVSIDTNPIDDSKTVVLALTADEGHSTYGQPISLILRCQSNKTEVYINWADYLGSEAEVTTRIGDATAQTRRWPLSTDSKATFLPGNDIAFIRSLMEADQFVAQVTPYSESPVTAVFDTKGLTEASKPLRETCNW